MGRQYMNITTPAAGTDGGAAPPQAPIPNHIIGAFDNGEDLWISEDLGVTWIEKTTLGTVSSVEAFAFVTANDIVCGCNSGYVAVSHDKGDTWTLTKPFIGITARNANCVRTFGNSVVISGDDETPNLYVGFSPDKGDTWYNLSADILAVQSLIIDYDYCYLLSETKMFFCSGGGDIIKVIYDGVGNFTVTNMGDVGGTCMGIRSVSDTEHYFTSSKALFHTIDDFVSWTSIHAANSYDELPRSSTSIGCYRLAGFYDNKLYHLDANALQVNGWTFNVLTNKTLTVSEAVINIDNTIGNNIRLYPMFMFNKDIIYQFGYQAYSTPNTIVTPIAISRNAGQTWTLEHTPVPLLSQPPSAAQSGSIAAFNIDTNQSINY